MRKKKGQLTLEQRARVYIDYYEVLCLCPIYMSSVYDIMSCHTLFGWLLFYGFEIVDLCFN